MAEESIVPTSVHAPNDEGLSSGPLMQVRHMIDQSRALLRTVATPLDGAKLVRGSVAARRMLEQALKACADLEGDQYELKFDAAEMHLRTQRRAGELLSRIEKHPGGRPEKRTGSSEEPVSVRSTKLQDLGIDKHESHRWQMIASIPEPEFEIFLRGPREKRGELTTRAAIALAKRFFGIDRQGAEASPVQSAGPAIVAIFDRAKRQISELIWLDPTALVRALSTDQRDDAAAIMRRLERWQQEFSVALASDRRRELEAHQSAAVGQSAEATGE